MFDTSTRPVDETCAVFDAVVAKTCAAIREETKRSAALGQLSVVVNTQITDAEWPAVARELRAEGYRVRWDYRYQGHGGWYATVSWGPAFPIWRVVLVVGLVVAALIAFSAS